MEVITLQYINNTITTTQIIGILLIIVFFPITVPVGELNKLFTEGYMQAFKSPCRRLLLILITYQLQAA